MNTKAKNIWQLIIACQLAVSILSAEENAQKKQTIGQTQKTSQATQPPPGAMPAKTNKVFTAKELKGNNRVFITGEVLLWKAQQDDMSFAVESNSKTTIDHGKTNRPDFVWDWGFRVGVGYNIPHDGWDIYMNYTNFYTNAHAHKKTTTHAIFPVWQAPFANPDGGYVTSAKAHWRLHLNLADVELGKAFIVGRWLSLRPFVGLRSAFIYQKYDIDYKGGTAVPADDEYETAMRNNFWGVGLRMGFDSLWGLGKGFSLFGDGAFSLLSGHFNIHQKEQLEHARTTFVNISSHPNNVATILELALGLQYDYLFRKDSLHLGVKLGYEFNYFFDQNKMMRFLNSNSPGVFSRNNGDLTLQGVTLGLRFDF